MAESQHWNEDFWISDDAQQADQSRQLSDVQKIQKFDFDKTVPAKPSSVTVNSRQARIQRLDGKNPEQPKTELQDSRENLRITEELFKKFAQIPNQLIPNEVKNRFIRMRGIDQENSDQIWNLLVYPTPVGAGGVSEVFVAFDQDSKKTVAIKVPRREGYLHAKNVVVESFAQPTLNINQIPTDAEKSNFSLNANPREWEALKDAESPFLPEVYGTFVRQQAGEQEVVLVMEYLSPFDYMSGKEYATAMKEKPDESFSMVAENIMYWVSGLEYVIDWKKMANIDVSPSNIMFPRDTWKHSAKLIDFGTLHSNNSPLSVVGITKPFSPPEILDLAKQSDEKLNSYFEKNGYDTALVYSLAATILHIWDIGFILPNEVWSGENEERLKNAIAEFAKKVNSGEKIVSEKNLIHFFELALDPDPRLRIQNLTHFLILFQNCHKDALEVSYDPAIDSALSIYNFQPFSYNS